MTHIQPFSGNRFELEGEHTYFLQEESFGRLQTETPKPVYLTGPRGTGKTTLLKAFDLNERRKNQSLIEQLGDDPFASPAGPFIGVYFRVPDIQLGLIEAWAKGQSDEDAGKLLAFYLDLQWSQEITRAIATLLAEAELSASTAEEREAVGRIVNEFPRTFGEGRRAPHTVAELRSALKRIGANLDAAAKRRTNWGEAIANYDAVQQPGAFGRFLATELATLCRRKDGASERWYFRVCIDEAETLTDLQLRALNSSVRLGSWPVFPVAAFGGVARDFTSTLLPHLSIQDADCDIIDLSEFLTARRFRELAEGVASARVTRILKERTTVDLGAMLGTFGVNGLLHRILADSVSPKGKELLAAAKRLQAEPFFSIAAGGGAADVDDTESDSSDDEPLPIYQAYLVEQLNMELPDPQSVAWRRRRQESAELRKRMVAAYLSICGDLKTQVRYASSRVVLGLSDLCIRDFLKFLNALHRASALPVQDFIAREMNWRDQHEALLAASLEKRRSIKGQDLRTPRETESVVYGLARITHLLQTESENGAHLRTTERGIFQLSSERWRAMGDRAARTLQEACDTGFLRFLAQDESHVSFRVHTSLAAAFEFSYRGAYYPVPLMWSDIEKLSSTRKDEELNRVAKSISSRISREENLTLFEN